MKFISTIGVEILSSDYGDVDHTPLSDAEEAAYTSALVSGPAWLATTTNFQELSDGVTTNVGYLWNWPAASFGAVRPDPLLGYIITFANSDLTRVIGQEFTVEWSWKYQPAEGYTNGAAPGVVTHTLNAQFTQVMADVPTLAIIPAQVVGSLLSLSLPRISTTNADNWIKVTGIPTDTRCRVSCITRFDTRMARLYPDLVPQLYGKRRA